MKISTAKSTRAWGLYMVLSCVVAYSGFLGAESLYADACTAQECSEVVNVMGESR